MGRGNSREGGGQTECAKPPSRLSSPGLAGPPPAAPRGAGLEGRAPCETRPQWKDALVRGRGLRGVGAIGLKAYDEAS
jgi:hypothetical protein